VYGVGAASGEQDCATKRATDVSTIGRCCSAVPALDRIIDGGNDEGDDECGGDEYGGINSYIVSYSIPTLGGSLRISLRKKNIFC